MLRRIHRHKILNKNGIIASGFSAFLIFFS